jgi:hypothetical protein
MPTVLRLGPYRFHFYSREDNEPPHIHVARDDMEAKFWLQPVSLAANYGFSAVELRKVKRIVLDNCQKFLAAYIRWHEQ